MDTPEGKRLTGRPVGRWEGNIEMQFGEVKWENVHWIHLAQDMDGWRAVVNTAVNLPSGFIKCREFLD